MKEITLSKLTSYMKTEANNGNQVNLNLAYKLYKKMGGKKTLMEVLTFKKNGKKFFITHQNLQ